MLIPLPQFKDLFKESSRLSCDDTGQEIAATKQFCCDAGKEVQIELGWGVGAEKASLLLSYYPPAKQSIARGVINGAPSEAPESITAKVGFFFVFMPSSSALRVRSSFSGNQMETFCVNLLLGEILRVAGLFSPPHSPCR